MLYSPVTIEALESYLGTSGKLSTKKPKKSYMVMKK